MENNMEKEFILERKESQKKVFGKTVKKKLLNRKYNNNNHHNNYNNHNNKNYNNHNNNQIKQIKI